MSISQRTMAPLAVVALAFAAILGHQAAARRPVVAPRPPTIAAVRIEPLFDGLIQRAQAKTEVEALEQAIRAEQQRRQAEITALEEKLAAAAGATKRGQIQNDLDLAQLKLRFWFQAASQHLEVEKAMRLQDLYRRIKTALEELAFAEGYDMIVLNDEIDEPIYDRDGRVSPQLQVLQQITSRHILYLNATLDITDDLIMRMNNAFRAAQAGP